jgi:hypothetical protein
MTDQNVPGSSLPEVNEPQTRALDPSELEAQPRATQTETPPAVSEADAKISQLETQITALETLKANAETGSMRKRYQAEIDRISHERSMLQLAPVLNAPEREAAPEPSEPADTIAPVQGISDKYHAAADAYLGDVQAIAKDMNVPASEAEVLFHFIAGRTVEDIEHDAHASLRPGEVAGPDLSNRQACETYLHRRYGTTAPAVIAAARKAFAALPADVQAYLDHDDGTGQLLTNSPSVIAGLAFFGGGYTKLSKEAASKELAQIRESKSFRQGDKLAIDKAHLLSLIVNRNANTASKESLKPSAAPKAVPPSAKSKLETELRSLRLDKAYSDRYAPNHKLVADRVAAIYQELHPESEAR